MIVLTTSAVAQTFKVIPRDYSLTAFTMSIRDDSTNVTVTYNITGATVSGNYVTYQNTFSPILVENHFYDMTLYVGTNIIFKDRIFCTDQTINQVNNDYYKLNEGQFTTDDSYNNEYIVA
tara:strand:+ start:759 stop:1118 length:360 start_codon:yes stop_codon:yes gene_type:complete